MKSGERRRKEAKICIESKQSAEPMFEQLKDVERLAIGSHTLLSVKFFVVKETFEPSFRKQTVASTLLTEAQRLDKQSRVEISSLSSSACLLDTEPIKERFDTRLGMRRTFALYPRANSQFAHQLKSRVKAFFCQRARRFA
jgi:hypothetical protein